MGSPVRWDNRAMFERYLYDYFIKNGMQDTAEIFRREANLTFHPVSLPAIDVPDGFLHEWWLTFYEMFRAWQPKNPDNNGGSSSEVEQMANVSQQGDPSLWKEQEMNEQMINELIGLNTGDNITPFMGCHFIKSEQTSQGFTSSQPQQKSLTLPTTFYHGGNVGDIVAQGVGASIFMTLETEKIAPNERAELIHSGFESQLLTSSWLIEQYKKKILESPSVESGRRSKNSACSEHGSNGMPVATDCPSQTSSPIFKSFNDIVKLYSLHVGGDKDEGKASSSNSRTNKLYSVRVDDNKDEGKASSSNSQTNPASANTNTSNGWQLMRGSCIGKGSRLALEVTAEVNQKRASKQVSYCSQGGELIRASLCTVRCHLV